jgi:hypothetical protein
MTLRTLLFAAASLILAHAASAERWLKIDPNDPFSKEGTFHLFDVDSAMEDTATGYVYARMIYVKPADAAAQAKWYVWAFDCTANTVYYVASPPEAGDGTKAKDDWRLKPAELKEPVMGGVTNTFGKKLCALKGSWPKGDLPK